MIRIDENSNNTPIQPPSELPEAVVPEGRLVIRKLYPETWLWVNTTTGYVIGIMQLLFKRFILYIDFLNIAKN